MKVLRNLVLLFLVAVPVLFLSSCDDSGTLPPNTPAGTTSLNVLNLKPLNPAIDGMYQLWVQILDTSGAGPYYKNLGKFNTLANGTLVDSAGNSFNISFGTDTLIISFVKYALITVEQPGTYNPNPGPAHLLAGPLAIYQDSLGGALTISDSLALGTPGFEILNIDHAHYILWTSTNPLATCVKGIWFSDSLNNPSISNTLNLPNTGGWIYEGWVVDNSLSTFYTTGKFFDTDAPDQDIAGPCSGPNPPIFNKPGQEWTIDSCSTLTDLRNGHCGVFIALTPRWHSSASPFFLKILEQSIIDPSLGCGQIDNLFNRHSSLPYGRIRIAR